MPHRVMIVDDDDGLRDFVRIALEGEGCDVVAAPNGAEALHLASERPPSVILLDMAMPVVDGRTFAAAYRRLPGPHAPIIACTAHHDLAECAHQIQADGLLAKPFDLDDLLEAVSCYAPGSEWRYGRAQPPGSGLGAQGSGARSQETGAAGVAEKKRRRTAAAQNAADAAERVAPAPAQPDSTGARTRRALADAQDRRAAAHALCRSTEARTKQLLVNAEGRLAAAKERGWSMGARTKQLLVNAEGRLARARALCQSLGEACGRGGYGGAGRFVRSPFG